MMRAVVVHRLLLLLLLSLLVPLVLLSLLVLLVLPVLPLLLALPRRLFRSLSLLPCLLIFGTLLLCF